MPDEKKFILPSTDPNAAKAAKIAAVKEQMGKVTAAKEAEAKSLAGVPEELKKAYAAQGGAAKLGTQAAIAGQLAQQEVGGAGYNKAAARQAAGDIGLQNAMALGQIGVKSTQEGAAATEKAMNAKSEAAAQKYEELTAAQKLDKEVDEAKTAKNVDLNSAEDTLIAGTKGSFDDDEEAAVDKLMQQYNNNKQFYDADPAAKDRLAQKIAGIRKNAGANWNGQDAEKFVTSTMGVSKQTYDDASELDY